MLQIKYKNLERSNLSEQIVSERLLPILAKFKRHQGLRAVVTLAMENAPGQAGADFFKVHLRLSSQGATTVHIQKSAQHLYYALALLVEALQERLNRETDRRRMKQRSSARQVKLQTRASRSSA